MGVHTFATQGNDTTVRAPSPGDVMVANAAGAWDPRPLTDIAAFPTLSELRHAIAALAARVVALEAAATESVRPVGTPVSEKPAARK